MYLLQSILLKLGILIILIAKADRRRFIPRCPVALGVLGVVLLMLLVLGDRSEFIYTIAVVLFAYSLFYRPIPLPVLVGGVAVLSLLMSAVQEARRHDERSVGQIVEALDSATDSVSVSAGLTGISSSGGVLLAAVTAVPDQHPYFLGELKLQEILGIVPFGRSIFLSPAAAADYSNTSTFLTWYVLGPNSTAGTGTTIVADLYIDFGVPGVVLGLLLLGYIVSLVRERATQSTSITYAVLFCYFAGLMVLLPRYSFFQIIRGLLWPLAFFWLLRKVTGLADKRRVRLVHART